MVNEIFTGELKWYKLTDNGYMLLILRSKSDKKESDIAEQKSHKQPQTRLIQKVKNLLYREEINQDEV